jgi:hypothetical protein
MEESGMSYVERIDALKSRHQFLEHELKLEGQRPLPDSALIIRLKREKLWIKDEMSRLVRN